MEKHNEFILILVLCELRTIEMELSGPPTLRCAVRSSAHFSAASADFGGH